MTDSEIRRASPPKPGEPRKETRRGGGPPVKDFAVMGRDSGPVVRIAIVAFVVIAVIAGAVFAIGGIGGGGQTPEDPDNLLRREFFSFEGAGDSVAGWQPARAYQSKFRGDTTHARHGKGSLLVEKSPAGGDFVVEFASAEQFALKKSNRVEATAYARSEGFGGWCAIKVNWFSAVNGALLLEELSAPASKPADWTQVRGDFPAPPGAGAFSVALCAVGRSGRIWFDDVRVYAREGGAAASREARIGGFTFAVAPNGVLAVSTPKGRVLANLHLALESDKDGRSAQVLAQDVKVDVADKRLAVEGKLASPVDLQPVDFALEVREGEGEALIGGLVTGERAKQVERMLVLVSAPGAERIGGLPTRNETVTSRVYLNTAGEDFVLDYGDPVKVDRDSAGRAPRLTHTLPMDAVGGEARLGFRLRRGAGDGQRGDPLKEAKRAEEERKAPGEALRILSDALKAVKEPPVREEIAREIRRLEGAERSEWNEVRARYFLAWISRRIDLYSRALDEVASYQRRWIGDPFAGKAQTLREEIDRSYAEALSAGEEDRAARMLEAAKKYRDKGNRSMAATLCELIVQRYASTKAAAEAQDVLKGLRQ
jgi:hypothetical protein